MLRSGFCALCLCLCAMFLSHPSSYGQIHSSFRLSFLSPPSFCLLLVCCRRLGSARLFVLFIVLVFLSLCTLFLRRLEREGFLATHSRISLSACPHDCICLLACLLFLGCLCVCLLFFQTHLQVQPCWRENFASRSPALAAVVTFLHCPQTSKHSRFSNTPTTP